MNDNNKLWTDDETQCLLDIWGSKDMQDKLAITKRNRLLWEDIARLMSRRGYQRSNKQCGGKIHNMKVEYRKVKYYGKKPHHAFKFFDIMDAIMTKQDQRTATSAGGFGDAGEDSQTAMMKYEIESDNESMIDDYYDEEGEGESSILESRNDASDHSAVANAAVGDRIRLSPKLTFVSTIAATKPCDERFQHSHSASDVGQMAGKRHGVVTCQNSLRKRVRQYLSTPDSTVDGGDDDILATVLDKVRDMQKQSDERYYAWEEKRLRIEREFEERRQQREMERESKRDEFFVKMATILTGQQQQQRFAESSNSQQSNGINGQI